MNFKKVLIFGLLISSIWAVNSNDNPENDNDEISSDENEDEDGKS